MLRSKFFVCGLESFSFSAMQYGNRAVDAVGDSENGQSFFDTTPASTRAYRTGSVPEAGRRFRRCSMRRCPKCYSILASVFVGKITALIGTWNGGVETGTDCEVAESEWAPKC
jgi:hypothetical protein